MTVARWVVFTTLRLAGSRTGLTKHGQWGAPGTRWRVVSGDEDGFGVASTAHLSAVARVTCCGWRRCLGCLGAGGHGCGHLGRDRDWVLAAVGHRPGCRRCG